MVETYPALQFAFSTLRRFEALAVRQSLGVLTVCAALEDVAHGHAPDKPIGRVEDTTLLIPDHDHSGNGYPEGLLPAGVDGKSPIAMYVGNLEHYQGIGLLLEGFRHALLRVPNAHLVIVGGLQDDIAHYSRRAVVLVSPRLKGLNTPMKIYSYLDSGTAVLATRLRTHTQILDDRTAYLVEPEPEALGEGLAELLNDPVLR